MAFVTNGNLYYIHNDHLGTPQVVTDQNQQVVWMGDYQPFGKLADTSQANSIELYSRFPGQYLDSETGLYYNYFRDYDPSIGRYIESDPIGLEGGITTYAYVGGNPIKYVDPTGEAAQLRWTWSVGTNTGRGINWAWEAAAGKPLGISIYDWVHGEDEVKSANATETNCPPDSDTSDDDKNCEALYQSALATCASLTGRKNLHVLKSPESIETSVTKRGGNNEKLYC